MLPELAARHGGVPPVAAFKADVRALRRRSALAAGLIYRRLPAADHAVAAGDAAPAAPLGPSRRIVYRLAALFSLDAFAGGLVVQSLLALWLFEALRPVAGGHRPSCSSGPACSRRCPTSPRRRWRGASG